MTDNTTNNNHNKQLLKSYSTPCRLLKEGNKRWLPNGRREVTLLGVEDELLNKSLVGGTERVEAAVRHDGCRVASSDVATNRVFVASTLCCRCRWD